MMDTYTTKKIVLLGAGNLAWHLGPALVRAGYEVIQVYSRSEGSAGDLAGHLKVDWTTDAGKLDPEAEILLYCVSDRVIPGLSRSIELPERIMIHTAGSVPADVFKHAGRDYGVLYPMMTFTRGRPLDFRNVPVCIEASTDKSLAVIERMAGRLSNRVYRLDSEQRKTLHIAGIIASNFSNHMYRLSHDFLRARGMDFGLLRPLIMETASKVMEMDPGEAQTGPASRNDSQVIGQHIELLKGHPELQKLYTFVSDSIANHFGG
jgi:predicted short-subunit dehydrogenase-like oxidoreductase (DUF2520 family)